MEDLRALSEHVAGSLRSLGLYDGPGVHWDGLLMREASVQGLYQLLRAVKSSLARQVEDQSYRAAMASELHRVTADGQHSAHTAHRLKEEKRQLEDTLSNCELRLQNAQREHAAQMDRLRGELAESHKLVAGLRQRDLQHVHEIKRKEKDNALLSERLQKSIGKSRMQSAQSIDLSCALRRETGLRREWKNGTERNSSTFGNAVLQALEDANVSLRIDNERLRELYAALSARVETLASSLAALVPLSANPELMAQHEATIGDIAAALVDWARSLSSGVPVSLSANPHPTELVDQLSQVAEALSARVTGGMGGSLSLSQSQSAASGDTAVSELQAAVAAYQRIVSFQEQILRAAVDSASQSSLVTPAKRPAGTPGQWQYATPLRTFVDEDRMLLQQERRNLDEDRNSLLVQARLLDEQRRQLESEREDILVEKEKLRLMSRQF